MREFRVRSWTREVEEKMILYPVGSFIFTVISAFFLFINEKICSDFQFSSTKYIKYEHYVNFISLWRWMLWFLNRFVESGSWGMKLYVGEYVRTKLRSLWLSGQAREGKSINSVFLEGCGFDSQSIVNMTMIHTMLTTIPDLPNFKARIPRS